MDLYAKTEERVTSLRDFRTAEKCRILVNHESRYFDVTAQRAARLQFAAFSRENITLDCSAHFDRFRPDLASNLRVLPNRELSRRIDGSFHLAIDQLTR